jgi:hypothetical protein
MAIGKRSKLDYNNKIKLLFNFNNFTLFQIKLYINIFPLQMEAEAKNQILEQQVDNLQYNN